MRSVDNIRINNLVDADNVAEVLVLVGSRVDGLSNMVGRGAVIELSPAASVEDVVKTPLGAPWKKSPMSLFQEDFQDQGASSRARRGTILNIIFSDGGWAELDDSPATYHVTEPVDPTA
eukprot:CAMPEP_0113677232 /NCGR_PEP_ID=MMETSP0038_2-20120614/9136_1 /TAXON_ID=2898 /ORGANISM="Cryptomonas paramecium" /LENGTH=118 /DNA_ID=CAMNT_0000594453 /DNA_START=236 /DNA_END=590 /DNA_ORIENTATION=- /assembly_acc=CAM_ASM_000170